MNELSSLPPMTVPIQFNEEYYDKFLAWIARNYSKIEPTLYKVMSYLAELWWANVNYDLREIRFEELLIDHQYTAEIIKHSAYTLSDNLLFSSINTQWKFLLSTQTITIKNPAQGFNNGFNDGFILTLSLNHYYFIKYLLEHEDVLWKLTKILKWRQLQLHTSGAIL